MLHAVVMAGGSGTRFWPESRAALPKQLLRLAGEQTMLQATLDRLGDVVPSDRRLVVTSAALVSEVRAQLPALAADAVVGEPCRRDTAPCVGLAAWRLLASDPQAVMAVMPSDHVISPAQAFQGALSQAAALVAEEPDALVTFGVRPTYPAESFGYIERGSPLPGSTGGAAAFRVARFREKPDLATARAYLETGRFYWNAGIFVWRAQTIVDQLRTRQPELAARLDAIAAARGLADEPEVFAREFAAIRPISIDYAVLEHAPRVQVIEAPFSWDDIGSWQATARIRGADDQGNTTLGRHLGVATQGCIVRTSEQHVVATLGVRDLIVVHTPDATLVANKHDEESIRQLVKLLEERGWREYL